MCLKYLPDRENKEVGLVAKYICEICGEEFNEPEVVEEDYKPVEICPLCGEEIK